ncbi:Ff.00g011120.m01.CDS01 [Fusarium sp. VM40]|nr:Ff.00g011120.m01.CDS01 [Fusarium sp. VM40]
MVKIAIAGYGEISGQIIKALLSSGRHEITLLGRKDTPKDLPAGLTWAKVDYLDKQQLVQVLQGMHTVLSFITVVMDHENHAQINLINACVEAGVKRFAPSEWAFFKVDAFAMYQGKVAIRRYLTNLNRNGKVLEYCLFLPGVFMNYLGPPEKMEKGVSYTQLFLDFGECRAILPEGPDATVTFTTLEDMAKTVAKAVDYKGEWPVMGGIVGNRITISGLLQLGERIRGKKFTIEKVKMEDLKVNDYVTSWNPITLHPSIPEEQREIAGREFARLSLIGLPDGGWDVSDDWSKLLPDQKFVTLENFLQDSWGSV